MPLFCVICRRSKVCCDLIFDYLFIIIFLDPEQLAQAQQQMQQTQQPTNQRKGKKTKKIDK